MPTSTLLSTLVKRLAPSAALVALSFGASGCDLISEALNPMAAQVIFIEVGLPEVPPTLPVEIPVDSGVGVTAVVSKPLSGGSTGNPVAGAAVSFDGFNLKDQGTGVYSLTSVESPSLTYTGGAEYKFNLVAPGEDTVRTMTLITPSAADPLADVSMTQKLSDYTTNGWVVDLGGSFDNAVVLLVDQNGNVVYDNRPRTAADFVAFILDRKVNTVTIPAATFAAMTPGIYAIGAAPLQADSNSNELNTVLSKGYSGRLVPHVVQFQ